MAPKPHVCPSRVLTAASFFDWLYPHLYPRIHLTFQLLQLPLSLVRLIPPEPLFPFIQQLRGTNVTSCAHGNHIPRPTRVSLYLEGGLAPDTIETLPSWDSVLPTVCSQGSPCSLLNGFSKHKDLPGLSPGLLRPAIPAAMQGKPPARGKECNWLDEDCPGGR